ncbi:hypothetical protein [Sphingomonas sp. UNC305MFCol5.2]|uniref:hypothetical protein n=1 Tax=Sphingomonas sp. UNC305MFCol5.2 TaxID=1449076 RepID=UPI001E329D6B|nr:hypothetical protein [Sphingomonas sp. UNC305MFCol5.2]
MNRGRYRIGGQFGLAAAALAVSIAAPVVHAQQTATPAPTPTPAPSRPPNLMYLPNVTPERFTLGTPSPTPAPTPAIVPPPAPVATDTPRASAPARTASRPSAARAPVAQPTPSASPTAVETPAPVPSPLATAAPMPAPQTVPAAQPAGTPGWLWMLIGAGATALVFGGVWALRRRRGVEQVEAHEAPAASPPPPPPPARPVAPPPGLAPKAASPPAAAPSGEPFEIVLRPARIEVTERDIMLECELLIGNTHGSAAENVRVTLAMMTASPDQDRNIAGFHANPMVDPAGTPFDLAAGAGGRMPVRLALPRELVHVVEVAGRPMFVPMVMIELKWRAGISIRRFGVDFMVGTAGQGGKVGLIWLDRNQQARELAATRYLPRQAVAA